ncbi:MAG TPA: SAM-dependent methyltransferase [Acidimicrobiales bacterium]
MRSVDSARSDRDVELQVAPPTRLATYLRGGAVDFETDQEIADELYASHRAGVEAFQAVSAKVYAFVERAVRHLTDEVGIRQYLVMGASTSGQTNVHEMAQATAPEARAVYVLFDPLMLVYAHRLGRGTPGMTAYVRARMSDVDRVISRARGTLDLTRPVGLVMPANLAYVRKPERAAELVRRYLRPLAPGSHLVATHHASDLLVEEVAPVYRRIAELAAQRQAWEVAPRSRGEIEALLPKLELLDPGVVPVERWRPADGDTEKPIKVAVHAWVARKR